MSLTKSQTKGHDDAEPTTAHQQKLLGAKSERSQGFGHQRPPTASPLWKHSMVRCEEPKTSPLVQMVHDMYMQRFETTALRLGHNFLHKRMTAPEAHPSKRFIRHVLDSRNVIHKGPVQTLIGLAHFRDLHSEQCEIILPFVEPPWTPRLGTLHNLEMSPKECLEKVQEQVEERTDNALVVFTDGSFLQEIGGGAAAASWESWDETRTASFTPPDAFSNNEMEFMGIALRVALFRDHLRNSDNRRTNLALFSDSQTALRETHSLLQPASGQSLIKFFKTQIRQLPDYATLDLFWTPGHEGIELNEVVDTAAGRAAKTEGRRTRLPMSLPSLLQATWKALSVSSSDFPNYTPGLKTPAKKIADAFNRLEKGQAAAIFQLRTGHCPLNAYLHRFKRSPTKYCRRCGVPETVAHFLLYCRKYRAQRRTFRIRVKTEKLRANLNSVNGLLDGPKIFPLLAQYVVDTGRFEHLCSYLPDGD